MTAVQFLNERVHRRIEARGIHIEDITYCISNASYTYQVHSDIVHCCQLSSGQHLKVATQADKITITNAFFHK